MRKIFIFDERDILNVVKSEKPPAHFGSIFKSLIRGDPLYVRMIIDRKGRPGYAFFTDQRVMVWLHQQAWLRPDEKLAPWWKAMIREFSQRET